VTDEQRREAGCIDGQNDAVISGQALTKQCTAIAEAPAFTGLAELGL
jgi:hypothetical protein